MTKNIDRLLRGREQFLRKHNREWAEVADIFEITNRVDYPVHQSVAAGDSQSCWVGLV